ncbi:MAG: histidine phosphatase family protein [Pseudomonadota bacterium]
MKRFHFLRHAPTHAKTMVGWTDLSADLSNQAAMEWVANRLPDQAVCISSDLTRCVTTLDAVIGGQTRLPHQSDIREFHFGAWENRSFADIHKENPDLITEFWSNPGSVAAPEGETWDGFSNRVTAAVDAMAHQIEAEDIVICAHFGSILTQLARAGNMTAKQSFSFKIDNLSLTVLTLHNDGTWAIEAVNQTM